MAVNIATYNNLLNSITNNQTKSISSYMNENNQEDFNTVSSDFEQCFLSMIYQSQGTYKTIAQHFMEANEGTDDSSATASAAATLLSTFSNLNSAYGVNKTPTTITESLFSMLNEDQTDDASTNNMNHILDTISSTNTTTSANNDLSSTLLTGLTGSSNLGYITSLINNLTNTTNTTDYITSLLSTLAGITSKNTTIE